MYDSEHTILAKMATTVLGIERPSFVKELVCQSFGNLTVISGSANSGKNTLLAGIALNYDKKDCIAVLTESYDLKLVRVCDVVYDQTIHNDTTEIIEALEGVTGKNIFIEQYQPKFTCNWQPQDDMKQLMLWSKETNNNVYICVHSRRIKEV
ncbi:hypothetical protein NVP1084O_191 [Vibrio phage 1.084.O._10N.261.49.F5]|nr:hypothetical protein NVP1084O_191 [Vibrio phage 1.084.O._10N.261.49.F5]